MRGRDRRILVLLLGGGLTLVLAAGAWADVPVYQYHEDLPSAEKAAAAPAAVPAHQEIDLTGAYQGVHVEGNRRRFEQYSTPPDDGYASDVRFSGIGNDGNLTYWMEGQQLWEEERRALLGVRDVADGFDLQLNARRDRRFQVFEPGASPLTRSDVDARLLYTFPHASAAVGLRDQSQRGQTVAGARDWSATDLWGEGYWQVGDFELRGEGRSEDLGHSIGGELTGLRKYLKLSAATARDSRNVLEGSLWRSETDLDSFTTDQDYQGASLKLSSRLSSDWRLRSEFFTQELTETITQNGTQGFRRYGRGDLTYTGWRQGWVQAGLESRRVSYSDRFQFFYNEPGIWTYWAKARWRPGSKLTLRGDFNRRHTEDVPVPLLLNMSNGSPILWEDTENLRGAFDWAISQRSGLTGRWERKLWQLPGNAAETKLYIMDGTGWWMVARHVQLWGSFQRLAFRERGVDGGGLASGNFTTDAETYTGGCGWDLSPRTDVNASLAVMRGIGAQAHLEHVATLSCHHDFSPQTSCLFRYTWNDFDDSWVGTSTDFDASLIAFEVQHAF